MPKINCKRCNNEFYKRPGQIKKNVNGCFCSRICKDVYMGGKRHPRWKGLNASFVAFHIYIRRVRGKPKKCEHCRTIDGTLEWANKNHKKYKRDPFSYISLCKSCHVKYDMTDKWRKNMGKGHVGQIPWNKNMKFIKPIFCKYCKILFYPRRTITRFCSNSCSAKVKKNWLKR